MTKEEFALMYQEQQSSGLNMKAYCALHGLSISNYAYWRRKYGIGCAGASSLPPSPSPLLAPVQIMRSGSPQASGILIELPSGARIGFGSGHEREAMEVISRLVQHV